MQLLCQFFGFTLELFNKQKKERRRRRGARCPQQRWRIQSWYDGGSCSSKPASRLLNEFGNWLAVASAHPCPPAADVCRNRESYSLHSLSLKPSIFPLHPPLWCKLTRWTKAAQAHHCVPRKILGFQFAQRWISTVSPTGLASHILVMYSQTMCDTLSSDFSTKRTLFVPISLQLYISFSTRLKSQG